MRKSGAKVQVLEEMVAGMVGVAVERDGVRLVTVRGTQAQVSDREGVEKEK